MYGEEREGGERVKNRDRYMTKGERKREKNDGERDGEREI